MSVSSMKRLTVFTVKDSLEELQKKLMRLRCVEISACDCDSELTAKLGKESERRQSELEARLAKISKAIDLLDPYAVKKKTFFLQKKTLNFVEFKSSGRYSEAEKAVEFALEAEERKNRIKEQIFVAKGRIVAVSPYLECDIPLSFTGTQTTDAFIGVLPKESDTDALGKELYELGAVNNIFSKGKNGVYAVFICHKSNSKSVFAKLCEKGFSRAVFPDIATDAKSCTLECERMINLLTAEQKAVEAHLVKTAESIFDIEALYDVCATELELLKERQKLVGTQSTVMIKGWIPKKREAAVTSFLEGFECAYETADPEDEDIPPVLLENNGFASNFEWVLGMYSYPAYGTFDPTFIMSIFYFIIFGIMFADVGYGALLILACFGAVIFLKPAPSMKRFLKMFGYCGIASVIFGALFGSYFGDMPIAIMKNIMGVAEENLPNLSIIPSRGANLALFLDPLQNPMGFLAVALGMGCIHLVAGMAVNFFILCKEKKVLDAFLDIGSYWILFAGIGLIFVNKIVGISVAAFGALMILLTKGRNKKGIIGKAMGGLLGLYDLISYASDLLSYSRILALGLSASIIAQVINILGTSLGPMWLRYALMVLVFPVGHVMNLAINVLGTFVHTSRLQYIEFFGKFFVDGGVPFEPTVPSEKYTEDITDIPELKEKKNSKKIKKKKEIKSKEIKQ